MVASRCLARKNVRELGVDLGGLAQQIIEKEALPRVLEMLLTCHWRCVLVTANHIAGQWRSAYSFPTCRN